MKRLSGRTSGMVSSAAVLVASVAILGGTSVPAAYGSATLSKSPAWTPPSTCAKPGGGKYTFALIPGDVGDPFYITMHTGAAAEAKKLGVTLEFQGAANFDPTDQLPVMNTVLISHPDALLWVPTDQKSLDPAAQKFLDAKIPIITLDNFVDDSALYSTEILSKDTQGGVLAADRLAQLSHGKGEVAIMDSVAGNSLTDQRSGGFNSELRKYPGMKVVAHVYDNNSATTADADTRSILLAHPGLVGIFATSDAGGSGAGTAVQGMKVKVPIVSYDAAPDEVKLLKQGVLDSLIVQPPAEEGATGVELACSVMAGKSVPKEIQLDNIIATRQNYMQPSIAQYFYHS